MEDMGESSELWKGGAGGMKGIGGAVGVTGIAGNAGMSGIAGQSDQFLFVTFPPSSVWRSLSEDTEWASTTLLLCLETAFFFLITTAL